MPSSYSRGVGRVEAEIGRIDPLAAPFVANRQPEMAEVHDCSVAYPTDNDKRLASPNIQPDDQLVPSGLLSGRGQGRAVAGAANSDMPCGLTAAVLRAAPVGRSRVVLAMVNSAQPRAG